jgi:phenylphosphate carboxylase gamma subunit
VYNFDVFVNSLGDLPEGKEIQLALRDLTPGRHKYCYRNVVAMVSANPETYPEKLQIRFGRGQAHSQPYSIKILNDVDRIPERWR